MKHLFLPIPILLLFSCGDGAGTDNATAQPDSTSTPAVTVVDLASHGLPLLLSAPDRQLTGGMEPSIIWKDETGTLEITAGDHFGLTINEEPGDIPRLKASLERDLLRKNTLLRETPEQLIYRSEFPDDPTLAQMHFYQVISAGDRVFVVQDIDGPSFNEQDIQRMMAAVSAKPPA